MKFSVIVPAHNEEKYIGKCFSALEEARKQTTNEIELIVCLNRCTDKTEEMARNAGAIIVKQDEKNLAKIRNTGVKAATGDVVVTIDADSQMSPRTFKDLERALLTGKYIGGGTLIKPERWSLGIFMSTLAVLPYIIKSRVHSAGMFWCYKKDFEAIGGFNETLVSIEDVDFAQRLKAFGKTLGKRYGTLWRAPIVTSCRKFDRFGDWYFFTNPKLVRDIFKGTEKGTADRFYYDFKR